MLRSKNMLLIPQQGAFPLVLLSLLSHGRLATLLCEVTAPAWQPSPGATAPFTTFQYCLLLVHGFVSPSSVQNFAPYLMYFIAVFTWPCVVVETVICIL